MKFLICGAGPAGLAFANKLLDSGIDDFLVLEAEPEAGGLCRSVQVDNAPIDIGGGHFLDVRRPKVNEFLFRFMPEDEWNLYIRDSRIFVKNQYIGHPFEANIWQFDVENQIEYLKAIAKAGCNVGSDMPNSFIAWIQWKLGDRIASDYMIPYNQKMFGEELNCLGTYWLEKLPDVSFEDTLRSCLTQSAYGIQPGHAQFYYPKKYGYGELWLRMAKRLGNRIEYNKKIVTIDFDSKNIVTSDGSIYYADTIITSIPWTEFKEIIGMPKKMKKDIKELKYSSVQIEYFNETIENDAQWIYYPDLNISYHRILVRHNFCENSRGYWTETNSSRIPKESERNNFTYLNQYAYPLNTIRKPEIMKELLAFAKEKGVYGLGRWGEHQHYNSDLTVELALNLAEKLAKKI